MPWEIDYALLLFTQLKKASQYLNSEDKIYIDTALNLSDYIINWNKSKLPKQYFIDKYNALFPLLDWANHKSIIYEGNELWGHLDMQKVEIEPHIDYYIKICADMWFHDHLLYYMIEGAKQIKDKYFVITPETFKLWDWTWDILVHNKYKDIPYDQWHKLSNIFEIESHINTLEEPYIELSNYLKWAGWFDLYSKAFVEELVPVPKEWKGYGPWDYYGMLVSDIACKKGIIVNEYILKNQIICEYHPNKENKNNYYSYYKDLISLNKIEDQRRSIDSKFPYYIEQWCQYAKDKKII